MHVIYNMKIIMNSIEIFLYRKFKEKFLEKNPYLINYKISL